MVSPLSTILAVLTEGIEAMWLIARAIVTMTKWRRKHEEEPQGVNVIAPHPNVFIPLLLLSIALDP